MKYKLIYDYECEKIIDNDLLNGFQDVNNDFVRIHYKMGKDKIEVIKLDVKKSKLDEMKIFDKDKNILIIKEINKDNIKKILKLKGKKGVIILTLQKKYNEKINLSLILMSLIGNSYKFEKDNWLYFTFGKENRENIGLLALDILKNNSYISKCKTVYLNLFLNKEYNLQELIYIEDPLEEYLDKDCKIIIKQSIKKDLKNKIYYTLVTDIENTMI